MAHYLQDYLYTELNQSVLKRKPLTVVVLEELPAAEEQHYLTVVVVDGLMYVCLLVNEIYKWRQITLGEPLDV